MSFLSSLANIISMQYSGVLLLIGSYVPFYMLRLMDILVPLHRESTDEIVHKNNYIMTVTVTSYLLLCHTLCIN